VRRRLISPDPSRAARCPSTVPARGRTARPVMVPPHNPVHRSLVPRRVAIHRSRVTSVRRTGRSGLFWRGHVIGCVGLGPRWSEYSGSVFRRPFAKPDGLLSTHPALHGGDYRGVWASPWVDKVARRGFAAHRAANVSHLRSNRERHMAHTDGHAYATPPASAYSTRKPDLCMRWWRSEPRSASESRGWPRFRCRRQGALLGLTACPSVCTWVNLRR
jgi:hypothetical protein